MDALQVLAAVGGVVLALAAFVVASRDRARLRASSSAGAQTEHELRSLAEASEDERRSSALILSSMHEGVLLFGSDGRMRFSNPSVERHLGVQPASVEQILPMALQDAVRSAA
ncbi:MAG: PAS domain-containing protein, partial [Actinomycetota bacterium]